MEETIKAVFSEPFGGGYPKSEAKRKISDANQLKDIRAKSQIEFSEFVKKISPDMVIKVRRIIERRSK